MRSETMKRFGFFTVAYLSLLVLAVPLQGAEKNSTVSSSPPKSRAVNELYPGLTTGALTYAIASELPKGVLLKAGDLLIHDKELREEIAEAQEQMRPKLEKNALFLLEQIATFRLLLVEARAKAAKSSTDISARDEQAIILVPTQA
jgi:hypothetical protein